MTDGVIKGTGNSRYLKSSISADTTLAQLITMLRDGTFPIDFNGINTDGWTTLATALNKANLLSDTTASKINANLGATTPTTVNEAINALAYKPTKIFTGSYTGTGTTSKTITFSEAPDLVVVQMMAQATYRYIYTFIAIQGNTVGFNLQTRSSGTTLGSYSQEITWSGATLSIGGGDAEKAMNISGETYKYTAFKK